MNQYINELKKLIEDNYDITVFSMSNIKNVYRICAVEGNFCLKQFKQDFNRFKHILDFLDYLEKREFDNVPRIIRTYDEKRYVSLEGVYFYMTKWVESRELNYSNTYDIIRASQHIAKFHKHTKGFTPSIDSDADIRFMKWIDIFGQKIDDIKSFREILRGKHELDVFDQIYFENIDRNLDVAKESIDLLYNLDYIDVMKEHSKKSYVCHHDLANHNILLDSMGKIYFIDFDYIIIDTYLHDIGSFILRCLKFGRWDKDKLHVILKSYKDVKYISKKEIFLTLAFILFPNDFWQIGIQRYKEKISWEDERFIKRLTRFENDKDDRCEFLRGIILRG